jgi:phage shock protein C
MSGKSKILLGVCGWLGQKLNIDPTLVRIAFIIFIFLGGAGLLLYLVLWIVKVLEEK